jgi:hypothetical protein
MVLSRLEFTRFPLHPEGDFRHEVARQTHQEVKLDSFHPHKLDFENKVPLEDFVFKIPLTNCEHNSVRTIDRSRSSNSC